MLNEESVMPDFETEFEAVEPGLHLLCREAVETTASGECGEDASRLYRKGRVHLCDEHVDSRWVGMRALDDRLASVLPAGFLRTARPEWITALQRDESEASDEVLEMLLMLDRAQRLMDGLNEAAEGAPARFETVMNAVTDGISDDLLEKYGQARERDIAEADDAEDPA